MSVGCAFLLVQVNTWGIHTEQTGCTLPLSRFLEGRYINFREGIYFQRELV